MKVHPAQHVGRNLTLRCRLPFTLSDILHGWTTATGQAAGQPCMQMDNTFTGVYIATGITQEGLQQHLAPWASARILDVRNLLPGTFAGFQDSQLARRVNDDMFALFVDKKWCCSGEQPMDVRATCICDGVACSKGLP